MGSFRKHVTPGGGGVNEVSHRLFLLFEALFLMLLEAKCFVKKQVKALRDTSFLISLIFQSNLGL